MTHKTFIYSTVWLWDIHAPQALEIYFSEKEKRNEVFIYQCRGELHSCAPNPLHKSDLCKLCIKKSTNLLEKLVERSEVVHFDPESSELDSTSFVDVHQLTDFKYGDLPVGGLVANQIADNLKGRIQRLGG